MKESDITLGLIVQLVEIDSRNKHCGKVGKIIRKSEKYETIWEIDFGNNDIGRYFNYRFQPYIESSIVCKTNPLMEFLNS